MKGIRHSLTTLINWLGRVRHYGPGNAIRLYRNLKGDVTFALRHYGKDFFLRGNSVDFPVFNGIFVRKEYDFEIDFIPEFIVDAGAFIGASSVWFSRRYPDARIVAVEPEETNFALLEKNTGQYSNIEPVRAALYGEDTNLRISDPSAEKYAFRVEMADDDGNSLPGYTVETLMARFGFPRIDILKMDIEGAEYELFKQGNTDWLRNVRVLVIELHEYFRPGVTELFYAGLAGMTYDEMRRGENIIIINREAAG